MSSPRFLPAVLALLVGLVACGSPAAPTTDPVSTEPVTPDQAQVSAADMWNDIVSEYSLTEVMRVQVAIYAEGGPDIEVTTMEGGSTTTYMSTSLDSLDAATSPTVDTAAPTQTLGPAIPVDEIDIAALESLATADSLCTEFMSGSGIATTPGGKRVNYAWCGSKVYAPSLVEIDGQSIDSSFTLSSHDDWTRLSSFLSTVAPRQTQIMALRDLTLEVQLEAVGLPDGTTGRGMVSLEDDAAEASPSSSMFSMRVLPSGQYNEGEVFSLQNYDLEPVWAALMEATGNDPQRITSLRVYSQDGVELSADASYETAADDDWVHLTLPPR